MKANIGNTKLDFWGSEHPDRLLEMMSLENSSSETGNGSETCEIWDAAKEMAILSMFCIAAEE